MSKRLQRSRTQNLKVDIMFRKKDIQSDMNDKAGFQSFIMLISETADRLLSNNFLQQN